jgi:phosphate transport system substrate-binding protein
MKILNVIVIIIYCGLIISCPVTPEDEIIGGNDVPENIDLFQFIPFTDGNKLAVLNRDASLKLHKDLPRLDGATALYPVYASFVQAVYSSTENYHSIWDGIVRCTTTPNAFLNLMNGYVDIIFCAAPSQEQTTMVAEKGKNFSLTPIGKDAFVFFVNKDNAVSNLSLEQIQGIYSGNITNWAEVGGKDDQIFAFQRPHNSGSQTALESIMEGISIMKPPVDRISNPMEGIIEKVAEYKNRDNAIGYSFLYFTTEMVNNNEIKLLSVEGVMPTRETIQSGKYIFSGAFYAITTGNETENTSKFMEWILSDEGQYLIEKTGYVPLR